MVITTITGTELSGLLRMLRSELQERHGAIDTLRVSTQGGGVMFKINEGAWTPTYGETTEVYSETEVWVVHRADTDSIEVFADEHRARQYAGWYDEASVSSHPVMNDSAAGQFIIDYAAGE